MRGDICPLLVTLLVLNEVWALGTYEYFQAFPVFFFFWKRFASLFQNVFMYVCAHKLHLHIINLTEIRASF